jgi:3-deoxy-D-manno-octulosonic-acid transferase
MFLIYSVLYAVVVTILLLPEYLKRPKGLRSKWLREKFGYLPESSSVIWVHAVSVGEVGASLRLLQRLKKEFPGSSLILSTITDTGQKVAREKVPAGTQVVYLPFDIGFILKRCIERINPRIFVVVETELWPNIFRALSRAGVPIAVVNGRISEKSARGYRTISFFMRKVFSFVRAFGVQGEIDALRLREIGAPKDKIRILGNFKFDMNISGEIPSWAEALGGPVIVAGSTHRGEEELILAAYNENRDRFPGLKLVLAPRHPERFHEVEELLKSSGIPYVRRSSIEGQPDAKILEEKIILLDTVGELSAVYAVADIAVIGKSFAAVGGQNPLEPAFWGKSIICGPHMENFPFIKDFYNALAKKIKELLLAPEKARAAGFKAKDLYIKNSGAVDRAVEMIRDFIR